MLAPDVVDAAFDHLLKSLLLERMTGMPRWNLTPAPHAEPIPKAAPRKALVLAPALPGLEEEEEPAPRILGRTELAALETAHLIGTDTPESIARRLGYNSTASLERALARASRPDLATAIRTRRAS